MEKATKKRTKQETKKLRIVKISRKKSRYKFEMLPVSPPTIFFYRLTLTFVVKSVSVDIECVFFSHS